MICEESKSTVAMKTLNDLERPTSPFPNRIRIPEAVKRGHRHHIGMPNTAPRDIQYALIMALIRIGEMSLPWVLIDPPVHKYEALPRLQRPSKAYLLYVAR